MSVLDVVFRVLNKAGNAFIEPRREDGHGSNAGNRTHVTVGSSALPSGAATAAKQLPNNHDVNVSNQPTDYPDSNAHAILNAIKSQLEGQSNTKTEIEGLPTIDAPTLVYVGIANRGTANGVPSWTILRIQLTPTTATIKSAKNARWDNRANEVYI